VGGGGGGGAELAGNAFAADAEVNEIGGSIPNARYTASTVKSPPARRFSQDLLKVPISAIASREDGAFVELGVLAASETTANKRSAQTAAFRCSGVLALLSAITPCTPPAKASNETNNAF